LVFNYTLKVHANRILKLAQLFKNGVLEQQAGFGTVSLY
jgi:hypothetical protein